MNVLLPGLTNPQSQLSGGGGTTANKSNQTSAQKPQPIWIATQNRSYTQNISLANFTSFKMPQAFKNKILLVGLYTSPFICFTFHTHGLHLLAGLGKLTINGIDAITCNH